jgi:hypothetical protein
MTTSRKRGLVLGVLLASCAALPTTAQAQATAPTLTTTTTCVDPSVNQSVDVAASGLTPGASYFPLLELTPGDGAVELGYGPGNIDADAAGTGSSIVLFDSTTYTQNAAAGDGSSVWVKLRDADLGTLSAELRIPICGADATPPVLTLPADIAVDATSASGATATFAASATDAVDGSVAVTCDHASGATFAVGTTTVSCSATDAAGNAATGSFTVTVRPQPQPQAEPEPTDLHGLLTRLGLDPRAAKNACNAITAAQNQIRARTGHGLTRAQADRLLATSRLIGALLHCR